MTKPTEPIPFRPKRARTGFADPSPPKPAVSPRPRGLPPAPGEPTAAQRTWLSRGLAQSGGKLPLFSQEGQRIDTRTVRSCIEQGWAEPWFANPLKPDWLVCRLTPAGRALFPEIER